MFHETIFWQRTIEEFWRLLQAPLTAPEILWIATPLAVTFLVMTFYFGVYRREELGWNTALGNTIVLLFVAIDLLRTMYNYTPTPSLRNFELYPITTIIILLVITEAILLFRFAFQHNIAKKVMFFIASPLPVNLQAYVIATVVYLKHRPTWHTLYAAVLLFLLFFTLSKAMQLLQFISIEVSHKQQLNLVYKLKRESNKMRIRAKLSKGRKAKKLMQDANELLLKSKALAKDLIDREQKQHGRLIVGKKLKKPEEIKK